MPTGTELPPELVAEFEEAQRVTVVFRTEAKAIRAKFLIPEECACSRVSCGRRECVAAFRR